MGFLVKTGGGVKWENVILLILAVALLVLAIYYGFYSGDSTDTKAAGST